MFQTIITIWFVLVGLSLLAVLYDALLRLPVSWVQKLAWILVVAYTGPVGLLMYMLTCRSPGPGKHDAYTRATWKQGVNSEMHCLAGDATGIFLAAVIVPVFGFANGVDLVIEYVAGYVVGLLLFQALMMRNMYDGNYRLAVRKTVFAETVSMNMVMLGMIPAMVLLNHFLPPDVEGPLTGKFWFVMSMATIVGGLTAYPVNYFLVRKGLKHGCMTVRRDDPFRGLRSDEASGEHVGHLSKPAAEHGHGRAHSHGEQHSHHGQPSHEGEPSHEGHGPRVAEGGAAAGHQMGQLSLPTMLFFVGASYAVLFLAAWMTSFAVPITFVR